MSRLESLNSELFQPLAEQDAASLQGGSGATMMYIGKSYDIMPDGTRIEDNDFIGDTEPTQPA
ncbi:hypothetical protein [Longimicrobium sp.]|uniref:hypothetical protein n=1 Tax=Longimicrobium sp. TaxID=2029185 RepID=UPI002B9374C9|nr:hypothetical protein [Longimicrobium sp.]HSU12859.1 hypothetical protein [Longimicrobium sp.]